MAAKKTTCTRCGARLLLSSLYRHRQSQRCLTAAPSERQDDDSDDDVQDPLEAEVPLQVPVAASDGWDEEEDQLEAALEEARMGSRIGASGQLYNAGMFEEEHAQALDTWAKRIDVGDKLRRGHGDVASMLKKLNESILSAKHRIDAGKEPEPLPSEQAEKDRQEAAARKARRPKFGPAGEDPAAPPGAPPPEGVDPAAPPPVEPPVPTDPADPEATPPQPSPEPVPGQPADPAAVPPPGPDVVPEPGAEPPEPGAPAEPGAEPPAKPEEPEQPSPEEAEDLARQDLLEGALRLAQGNYFGTSPEYRMRLEAAGGGWPQVIAEKMTALWAGVSIHEIVLDDRKGPQGHKIVTDRLAWMHPRSVEEFVFDSKDRFLGILQRKKRTYSTSLSENAKKVDEDEIVAIPANKLWLWAPNPEGNNPEGVSEIRPMYTDAKHLTLLNRATVIGALRSAFAWPHIHLPENPDPTEKQQAIKLAKRLRGGAPEAQFAVTTGSEELTMEEAGKDVFDTGPIIRSKKASIRASVSAEVTGLGQSEGQSGSRSVGSEQIKFWQAHVGYLATTLEASFNLQVVERVHRLNYADDVPAPIYSIQFPLNVTQLIEAKTSELVDIDEDLKDRIREEMNLPPVPAEQKAEMALLAKQKAKRAEMFAKAMLQRSQGGGMPGAGDQIGGPRMALMALVLDRLEPDTDHTQLLEMALLEQTAPPAAPSTLQAAHVDFEGLDPPDQSSPVRRRPGRNLRMVTGIARELDREPSPHELRHTSLAVVDAAFTAGQQDFGAEVSREVVTLIDEAIKSATIDGDKVTVRKPSSKGLSTTMTRLSRATRSRGFSTAERELASQIHAERADLAQVFDFRSGREMVNLAKVDLFSFDDPDAITPFLGQTLTAKRAGRRVAHAITLDVDAILDEVVRFIREGFLSARERGLKGQEALDDVRRRLVQSTAGAGVSGRVGKMAKLINEQSRHQTSRAFSAGRAEALASGREALRESGADVDVTFAIRTSVLEPGVTCSTCFDLHGAEVRVDSEQYWELMPPALCEGGANCRCFYTFRIVPAALAAAA